MPAPYELEFSDKIIKDLAGDIFPETFAKLYAQNTRLQATQEGLRSWTDSMFEGRLNDAVSLIEAAFIQQENDNEEKCKIALKKAAEVLEWLAHPEINKHNLPLYLLSAATYQLAGYPARGLGILNKYDISSNQSKILQSFLKCDFQELIKLMSAYYSENLDSLINQNEVIELELPNFIINETIRVLGILYSEFRWGDEKRLDTAIKKFEAIEKLILRGKDSYSWLLCSLCKNIIIVYLNTSSRRWISRLYDSINDEGKNALNIYIKSNFLNNKVLAWASQVKGIEALATNESFLLCTPTGSGKTTIAELAIIQSLFAENVENKNFIVLYLVPKRALAAEVEFKLSKILEDNLKTGIKVTSLYGGNDYGPTELSIHDLSVPLVIISTQEKTDALIRLLGPEFLQRIKLVVIDEAHNVEFKQNETNLEKLKQDENRELRLESLITRLKIVLSDNTRFIGLSAVADNIEEVLSTFISGKNIPVKSDIKSTRQTIGRLYFYPTGGYKINYDIIDGKVVELEGEEESHPYVKDPLPRCPFPEKYNKLKQYEKFKPRLYWAAMNFAAQKTKGKNKTVLIAILSYKEKISDYSQKLLDFIENDLTENILPEYFSEPIETNLKQLYEETMEICEDYFGIESFEYRLLQKGIVVHHGKMPGKLGRRLVQLVEENIINIVLATSTLNEGINLPFESILVPFTSLSMSVKDFNNLIGRAGRPGLTTEGQTLVLLPTGNGFAYYKNKEYIDFVNKLLSNQKSLSSSSIAQLIEFLYSKWTEITQESDYTKFITWLEDVNPLETTSDTLNEPIEILDTFDNFLLSSIQELNDDELSQTDLEDALVRIWKSTYAFCLNNSGLPFEEIFKTRGTALVQNIYPDKEERKYFYKTGLPPRVSIQLRSLYEEMEELLLSSNNFYSLSNSEKIDYILAIVDKFDKISKLKIGSSKNTRSKHLKWWLDPVNNKASGLPSNAYDFISKNFIYNFNRAIGCLISIALLGQEETPGNLKQKTGLPWIIFWLKDLINWGTLDPVVAYLMTNDKSIITRSKASEIAQDYYQKNNNINNDELYNPETIEYWDFQRKQEQAAESFMEFFSGQEKTKDKPIKVVLLRDFSSSTQRRFQVIPVIKEDRIYWFDVAGYPLAYSEENNGFNMDYKYLDYFLVPKRKWVYYKKYLS